MMDFVVFLGIFKKVQFCMGRLMGTSDVYLAISQIFLKLPERIVRISVRIGILASNIMVGFSLLSDLPAYV